jgi:hypothetical protein
MRPLAREGKGHGRPGNPEATTALARREHGRGKRYTSSLKQRIADAATKLRGQGQGWQAIGKFFGVPYEPLKDQAERSEMIDVVELKYVVVEVERQKYVCKCGSVVETAPGPERAMDGGRYSLLWDQCWAATRLLEPTYDALFTRLRDGPVIGVDQQSVASEVQ